MDYANAIASKKFIKMHFLIHVPDFFTTYFHKKAIYEGKIQYKFQNRMVHNFNQTAYTKIWKTAELHSLGAKDRHTIMTSICRKIITTMQENMLAYHHHLSISFFLMIWILFVQFWHKLDKAPFYWTNLFKSKLNTSDPAKKTDSLDMSWINQDLQYPLQISSHEITLQHDCKEEVTID